MINLVDLTDKRIIITGASQGIGRDTAVMLSRLGAKLVLIARGDGGLKETLNLLEGSGHSYYTIDLSNVNEIEGNVKNIVKENGAIDGIVYCAGINNDRPLNMFKPDIVENVFKINLFGFIELVRVFIKKGRYNNGMRIVCISSVASCVGAKAHLAYAASKAGVNGAVRCMAHELAEKGICVNAVLPGMINTNMYQKYLDGNSATSNDNLRYLNRQYLGLGETNDVASAIAFLLSGAARFITGICLPVDGGYLSN